MNTLTPKAFRELTGCDPKPAAMTPDGHVRWEYSLDQLAQERGYGTDEELKAAVEQAASMVRELAQ